MKKTKFYILIMIISFQFIFTDLSYANNKKQIIVVDKSLNNKNKKEVCAQMIIPVPGKPGWFWTDACKKTIVKNRINK